MNLLFYFTLNNRLLRLLLGDRGFPGMPGMCLPVCLLKKDVYFNLYNLCFFLKDQGGDALPGQPGPSVSCDKNLYDINFIFCL